MLNKTGKSMRVRKKLELNQWEKGKKLYRTYQRDKFSAVEARNRPGRVCREHSNPVIFLESDLEFPELGPPLPRGAEGLESRSTIFANLSQLSSPGLQFLPIYHNSRVQV